MSHEIRTPMNGILGTVELLRESDLHDDQRQMASLIADSAHALLGIIDDVLDFSKIEAGKLELQLLEIDLADTLESVADLLAGGARRKGVELISFVDPHIPARVWGDPVRLRQIVVNLVGNAIKFTDVGKVVLRARFLSITDGLAQIKLEVVDSGIGISESDQKRLFAAFVQADGSTARRFGGTGLGLTISRRLVEAMGGEIGLDSRLGGGSTFWVRLSLKVAQSVDADPSLRLDGTRIAFASRDADLREAILSYLTEAGAAVALHEDPDAAVATNADALVVDGRLAGASAPRAVLLARDEAERRRRLANGSYAASVVRPVRRIGFLQAVAIALGRISPEVLAVQSPAGSVVTTQFVGDPEAARRAGLVVLVAEDHEINRAVITRQLTKLGYAVDVAENGVIALKLWSERPYALVLTDMHMPDMDGLDLARAIRAAEASDLGRPATPIVALTANALQGQDEVCRAAGMEDFLTKPTTLDRLSRVIARYAMHSDSPEVATVSTAERSVVDRSADPVDLDKLADMLGEEDLAVVMDVLDEFITKMPRTLARLDAAIEARDAAGFKDAAHAAKGASLSVTASGLAELCAKAEREAADAGSSATLAAAIVAEFARVRSFVANARQLKAS